MNRRPWPIILMAILQFLSPLLYIAGAAMYYKLSLAATTNEILALTPDLRKLEIFVLPVILGGLILLTKKTGYYVVIVTSIYLIVRGVMEFVASNQTDPVFPLILSNVLCLIVVALLLRPQTRSVYLNPRLRWWETSPRYLIDFPASITRVGGKPMKATMQNIADGGCGLETFETGFLQNEIINLEFQHAGEVYRLKAKIAWEKNSTGGTQYLGLQWAEGMSPSEWSKLMRLIQNLRSKRTRTTRTIPPRLSDVKEWFSKIAG